MKIYFKMLVNDGEQYYRSSDPGIAICDYVYLRGLDGKDDDSFWKEQKKHYQKHMSFDFHFDMGSDPPIISAANKIAGKIGFDKQRFTVSPFQIYLLIDGEFVEVVTPTISMSTLSKYYNVREDLHIFFMLSNQAGGIWNEDGLRYYMNSREAGRHNLPHVHVDYRHEASATISLYDGEMIEGDIPQKIMKQVKERVLNNQRYLMECWNKMTDGLRVDLNVYFGVTPLKL